MTREALIGRVRTAVFGISPDEAQLAVRGFAGTTDQKRERLESAGRAFVDGYRIALRHGDAQRTANECDVAPLALRGFAYEGAAMGLTLIDVMSRGTPHVFQAFIDGPAQSHIYMAYVGAGWALARCPWGLATFLPRLDPLLRPLAVDGLGFHEAFFRPDKFLRCCRVSWKGRSAPQAFDNGVGRAIWFAAGAQAPNVISLVSRFSADRQAAVWSGVGLAVTYAGGASDAETRAMMRAAHPYRDGFLVGSAFAAKARARAGNVTEDTARACEVICGRDVRSAAAATDDCLERLPRPHGRESYGLWRDLLGIELTAPAWAAIRAAATPVGARLT